MGSNSVTHHSPPPAHKPDDTHKPDNTNKPDKTNKSDKTKKDKKKDDSNSADQDQLNAMIVQFAISILQQSIQQSKEIDADLQAEDEDAF